MNPLDEGVSPVRSVRIPESLWSRLADWARASGVGDADALRELLRLGLETQPGVVLKAPEKWMLAAPRVHSCADGTASAVCLGAPCGSAWSFNRPAWLLARVLPGSDWWDLSEVLDRVPGAVKADGKHRQPTQWIAVPAESLPALRELFAGRADRIRVHSL